MPDINGPELMKAYRIRFPFLLLYLTVVSRFSAGKREHQRLASVFLSFSVKNWLGQTPVILLKTLLND